MADAQVGERAPLSEEQAEVIRARISAAIKSSKREKRHPLEVTSDRIGDALYKHHDRLSGEERDVLSTARSILEGLVEEALSGSWRCP